MNFLEISILYTGFKSDLWVQMQESLKQEAKPRLYTKMSCRVTCKYSIVYNKLSE